MSRSFFDTNVLVYLYDDDEPEKKAKALELFGEEVRAGRAMLSTQVLQEFHVIVTRKLETPLSHERAESRVRDLSKLPLTRTDEGMVLAAIARSRAASLSLWDALIVEAALKGGADRLLTEDLRHGQVIEGMRVENPFL